MAKWYYRIMGDEFGPLSTNQLIDALVKNPILPDTDVRKGTDSYWTPAPHVKGLLAAVDKRRSELKSEETDRKQAEVDLAEKKRLRLENLRISTCGPLPGKAYRVIDTIFALDSSGEAGLFFHNAAKPAEAFAKVKELLRRQAFDLGADAVVSCQFEYRVAITENPGAATIAHMIGTKGGYSQCVEIFAYGTAITYEK